MSSDTVESHPDTHGAADVELTTARSQVLGPASLVSLGLGGVVGAGIFVSVGLAARETAGPAVIVSFIIAAAACILVALCYSECASRVPSAGSTYAYGYEALGRFGGWLSGWNLITCYFLAGAAVAQAWSGYFQSFLGALGMSWPISLGDASINLTKGAIHLNLPAVLAFVCVTSIVYRGIRVSMGVNNLLLVLKLVVLAIVVVAGLSRFNAHNWQPFAPFGWGMQHSAGAPGAPPRGVLAGAALVFFAFGGFEMLSVYSAECKRPSRDVPTGIMATIGLITLIYVSVAATITGMTPRAAISESAPLSDAFKNAGMGWAQFLIAGGALIAMSAVLLVVAMSLPRVLQRIAQDNLLPDLFNRIHAIHNTPTKGILVVGLVTCLVSALMPLRAIMEFVMTCTLAGYASVCVFVLLLRHRDSAPTHFGVPGGALIPISGALVSLVLMIALPVINVALLAVWIAIGSIFYLVYGARRRSVEERAVARTGARFGAKEG